MRANGYAHILEHAVILFDQAVVDMHAGIVDDLVHDAERVSLRHPAEIVDGLRPVALAAGVDLVDGDDLARLRLGQQIVVVIAPPRGGVAAEALAGILRVGAGPRLHVDDADFDDVAGLGATEVDRAGADMDTESFAGAAAVDRSIHRTGATAIDVLLVLRPIEH